VRTPSSYTPNIGYFKSGVVNAAYEACGLKSEKLSFPAMRNSTVRMVLQLAYPRRLALGCLKQAVDGFSEAMGLARPSPGDDAVEMTKDHACDVLHGLDL